jgi:AbrB family looped-hinge helix DNA binding protein
MWLATVNARGQITIPKEVRERLGLREQDRVLFSIDEGGAHLVPVRQPTVASLAGRLASDRPYPGVEAVRDEVARALAEAIEREGGPCPSQTSW